MCRTTWRRLTLFWYLQVKKTVIFLATLPLSQEHHSLEHPGDINYHDTKKITGDSIDMPYLLDTNYNRVLFPDVTCISDLCNVLICPSRKFCCHYFKPGFFQMLWQYPWCQYVPKFLIVLMITTRQVLSQVSYLTWPFNTTRTFVFLIGLNMVW